MNGYAPDIMVNATVFMVGWNEKCWILACGCGLGIGESVLVVGCGIGISIFQVFFEMVCFD